jgi:hypothetical protein
VGEKIAQTGHAIAAWCLDNPEAASKWRAESEYLIVLETSEYELEQKLKALTADSASSLSFTAYHEPDMNNRVTAIAIAPGASTRIFCANLALAGRSQLKHEVVRDIISGALPDEDYYEDMETGLIDLEWKTEYGKAHLQLSDSRYGMYIVSNDTAVPDYNRGYSGKLRELQQRWYPEISRELSRLLYEPGWDKTNKENAIEKGAN